MKYSNCHWHEIELVSCILHLMKENGVVNPSFFQQNRSFRPLAYSGFGILFLHFLILYSSDFYPEPSISIQNSVRILTEKVTEKSSK